MTRRLLLAGLLAMASPAMAARKFDCGAARKRGAIPRVYAWIEEPPPKELYCGDYGSLEDVRTVFQDVRAQTPFKQVDLEYTECGGFAAAITTGGVPRKVVVCRRIFSFVCNRDQLAVVIGHEFAHFLFEHSKRAHAALLKMGEELERKAPRRWINRDKNDLVDELETRLCPRIDKLNKRFEFDADREGLRLAADAGYDCREGARVFREMDAWDFEQRSIAEIQVDPGGRLIYKADDTTHPPAAHRARAADRQIAELDAFCRSLAP